MKKLFLAMMAFAAMTFSLTSCDNNNEIKLPLFNEQLVKGTWKITRIDTVEINEWNKEKLQGKLIPTNNFKVDFKDGAYKFYDDNKTHQEGIYKFAGDRVYRFYLSHGTYTDTLYYLSSTNNRLRLQRKFSGTLLRVNYNLEK